MSIDGHTGPWHRSAVLACQCVRPAVVPGVAWQRGEVDRFRGLVCLGRRAGRTPVVNGEEIAEQSGNLPA
ncbi:hypothetical protein E2562_033552 [Oryza meyeriana var. granulata]|uniref:Uncharacterized protein n=1 Tax=Oryza meyeriana var. granulata TaxID=110450 RepID=A0A6G1ES59_9ORYZ|nr:hypothetical protein E2562_033552 [Oryza meyeriana var. granulata]